MKAIIGLVVFLLLAVAPIYTAFHWLDPSTFWQRIAFFFVAIGPETFLIMVGVAFAAVIAES